MADLRARITAEPQGFDRVLEDTERIDDATKEVERSWEGVGTAILAAGTVISGVLLNSIDQVLERQRELNTASIEYSLTTRELERGAGLLRQLGVTGQQSLDFFGDGVREFQLRLAEARHETEEYTSNFGDFNVEALRGHDALTQYSTVLEEIERIYRTSGREQALFFSDLVIGGSAGEAAVGLVARAQERNLSIQQALIESGRNFNVQSEEQAEILDRLALNTEIASDQMDTLRNNTVAFLAELAPDRLEGFAGVLGGLTSQLTSFLATFSAVSLGSGRGFGLGAIGGRLPVIGAGLAAAGGGLYLANRFLGGDGGGAQQPAGPSNYTINIQELNPTTDNPRALAEDLAREATVATSATR